jgi:large subunit ribosomal protein L6
VSRIGKKIITIPEGVTVEIRDGGKFDHKEVTVVGPKGSLSESYRHGVSFKLEGNELEVLRDSESKQDRSMHGLYRTLTQNMVDGVSVGFTKELEIVGIGYRAEMQGEELVLSVGFSHKVRYTPATGVSIRVEDQVNIIVEGADKQAVGEAASKIRSFRKPEPYKGKGIRYKGEQVKRKSTKTGK